jgi:DNA-binding PadR family transcriptional regulator
MRRGDIRTAMLAALQDGPGHGYELMNRLSERSGGRWRPSPGSVYPLLQALQDEGLLTAVETDGKRVFSLTQAGIAAAAERAASGAPEFGGGADDTHHNLRSSVAQLMAAAKMVSVNGSPELMEKADAIVTDARRKLYQLLAEA